MIQAGRTWTLLALLETTTRFFREKGLDSARVDAELLLAHVLGRRRIELYVEHDRPLRSAEVDAYREFVRRRASGEPVQRILGETEFYSITLGMAEGVFIPRPETELLVDFAVAFVRRPPAGEKIAFDAGTGTGAIAIAIARNAPSLRVIAVDTSPAAVACAHENARRAGVDDRVTVEEGDMVESLAERAGTIDLVVSNPPYVTTEEMVSLPPEVRDHDPHDALHGGADGLDPYRRIVPAAAKALRPGGLLILEVSDTTAEPVARLVGEEGRLGEAKIDRDYAGRRRVLTAEANR